MQTALPEPWRAALPDSSAPFCAELCPCTIFLRVVPGTTGRQYCIGTVRCSRKERLNVNIRSALYVRSVKAEQCLSRDKTGRSREAESWQAGTPRSWA